MAPPAKKGRMDDSVDSEDKESATISIVVKKWTDGQKMQISPVHRVKEYPFYLRIERERRNRVAIFVVCDMNEMDLWQCTTTITMTHEKDCYTRDYEFGSWYGDSCEARMTSIDPEDESFVKVTIDIKESKDSSQLRPSPDSIDPPNGVVVVGREKKEIRVNKEFMASQSPYFDGLFFGIFKEMSLDKIPIGDVGYEEFNNILRILYRSSNAKLTDKNVLRILDIARRFELKIVEEKVVSYLLIPEWSEPEWGGQSLCEFSLAKRFLISEEKDLPSLKERIFDGEEYILEEYRGLQGEPEYDDLSDSMKAEILDRVLDLSSNCRCYY